MIKSAIDSANNPTRDGYRHRLESKRLEFESALKELAHYDSEVAWNQAISSKTSEPLPPMPKFEPVAVDELGQKSAAVWYGEKKEIEEFLKAFEQAYGYNRDFANLLNEMARIHVKKNRDYAEDANRYSNFEYACRVAEPFTGVDKVFATMLGIKLARMAELKKGKTPNFESLADSHLDESVYSTLWASYNALKERENEKRRGDSPVKK
jgi:hypothetical protein